MIKVEFSNTNLEVAIKGLVENVKVIEIADIIRDSINDNFEEGKNASGGAMTSLKPKTIATKRKEGGINPSKPFIFKGGTRDGIKSQSVSESEAVVIPTGKAKGYHGGSISVKEVLQYQKKQGRDPFGISKDAKSKINKYLKDKWQIPN